MNPPTKNAKEDPGYAIEILDGKITPRLTLLTYGRTKHGKTQLALTAPGDIGLISLDANCKQIAQKYHIDNPDKKIHFVEFIRSPLSQIEDINEIKKFWGRVRDAYYKLLEMKSVKTVICDSHTQMWADCLLAYVGKEKVDPASEVDKDGKPTGKRFGTQRTIQRDYGEPKREIREMINACETKNLILICQGDDEYRNDVKTGKMKPKGMTGIEYLSQCEVECSRVQETGDFVARMMSSTANADIRGRAGALGYKDGHNIWEPSQDELMNGDINFPMIGISVFPQTELEDWE